MKSRIIFSLALLFSTVLLLTVALYNGYPLINSDTGSYVKYAFDFQVPQDRSPFYGVFTGFSSLWLSLWGTVIVQAVLVVFLIYRYSMLFWDGRYPGPSILLLMFLAIVVGTHVTWVVSFVMPDIFSAILLLATLLYFFDKHSVRAYRLVYLFIVFISIAVHNSHYLIYLLFAMILCLVYLLRKQRDNLRKGVVLLSITVANWLILCTLNYVKGFGFTLSSGSHVFVSAKLVETGIMKKYLDDSCGAKPLKLCQYKDELPNTLSEYLWEDYSPLYKVGGWQGSKAENMIIARDVFTSPVYLPIYIRKSIINSGRQLVELQLPEVITPMNEQSSPYNFISKHLPCELGLYKNARQFTAALSTGPLGNLYILVFLLSSCWVALVFRKLPQKEMIKVIYCFLLLFIVLNAMITATFSEVAGRFHYRVFWVLPATNIFVLVNYYRGKYKPY